jgi:anti-anti-sigma factor
MVSVDEVGSFKGSIVQQDGHVVVVVRGEVDMAVAIAFGALVDQALEVSSHVVFDMDGVTFFDSSGLRVLASTAMRVNGSGSVTIQNASTMVARVLRVSGIDSHITVGSAPAA